MIRTLHIVYNSGDYSDKAAFILCKTSNPSSKDLQEKQLLNGEVMYESVARLCNGWNSSRTEQRECPSILFYSIPFSSILSSLLSYPLFYPILSSILSSLLSYPLLFYPILFYPILFYPIFFSSILFYPLLSSSILSSSILSSSILSCVIIF